MAILVVGASGATGKEVVEQLIQRGEIVRVIVRSPDKVPENWKETMLVKVIGKNLVDISMQEMKDMVKDCTAVVSCLGHNVNLKGIFGNPRKLVTDTVIKLTEAITATHSVVPVKFILMNTAGNRNHDLNEKVSKGEKIALGLIRLLLPPHRDNEMAAEYLRKNIGSNHRFIHWVVVRPDDLINNSSVTEYEVFPSPIRSSLFNAGKTSRINVAHFMTRLITEKETWLTWKGKMPVIYNRLSPKMKESRKVIMEKQKSLVQ